VSSLCCCRRIPCRL